MLRFNEYIRLFSNEEEIQSLPEIFEKKKGKGHSREPPVSELHKLWNDTARDWICHIFAYAVPNDLAINKIREIQCNIIEIGAGTGYWGSLIPSSSFEKQIYLYDSHPLQISPQPEESKQAKRANSGHNEYHGKTLAFTVISKGGFTDLKIISTQDGEYALFLCYPPPGCSMALDCLQNFKGDYIIYVGEWQGDTATYEFEKALVSSFSLVNTIGLPNWFNTCYTFSLWKRKSGNSITSPFKISDNLVDLLLAGNLPLQCIQCGNNSKRIRRCVLCAQVFYCSQECCTNHATIHEQVHLFHGLNFEELPSFQNRTHYKLLKKPE